METNWKETRKSVWEQAWGRVRRQVRVQVWQQIAPMTGIIHEKAKVLMNLNR